MGFVLFLLSTFHLALGILRCPTRWQRSFCATATPSINISPSARFATVGASSSGSYVGLGAAFTFSCFLWRFRRAPEGFFFLWTMTGSPVSCKELSSCGRVPLFWMFPLSLQSIISNQMRPRRLRGAWFSRLLRHPARRRSGSILSPGTHTGYSSQYTLTNFVEHVLVS